jgi:RNA polymerase sigma-70 factor (sigma-E family)
VDRDEDFAAYVDARRRRLVRSAVLLGCSYQEAEDAAQTALTHCYRAWDKVQRASDVDAYVYRVLLNSVRESRSRLWWGERPSSDLPDEPGPDAAESSVVRATVRQALLRLRREDRAVLVLRFFADLSERQVAEALGIPAGTAKSRVSRALAQLSSDSDLLDVSGQGARDVD